jgi:hypothetical protein
MTSKPARRLRSAVAICALFAIPAIIAALAQVSTTDAARSAGRGGGRTTGGSCFALDPSFSVDGPLAVSEGRLYWVSRQDRLGGYAVSLDEANSDGSDPRPVAPLPSAMASVEGIAVAGGSAFVGAPDGIHVVALGGSGQRLLIPAAQTGGGSNYLSASASALYWSSEGGIWTAGLDGSNPHLLTASQSIGGLAATPTGVFWDVNPHGSGSTTTEYEIWSAAADGSNPHVLYSGSYQSFPDLGVITPEALAANASSLVVNNQGTSAGILGKAAIAGGSFAPLGGVLPAGFAPVLYLAADESRAYWSRDSGPGADQGFDAINLDGTEPRLLLGAPAPTSATIGPGCVIRLQHPGVVGQTYNLARGASGGAAVRLGGHSLTTEVECRAARPCRGAAALLVNRSTVRIKVGLRPGQKAALTFPLSPGELQRVRSAAGGAGVGVRISVDASR